MWGIEDAEVACREMGFIGADMVLVAAAYGEGNGSIWLDDVECTGEEESLFECQRADPLLYNCGHDEDASAVCTARGMCSVLINFAYCGRRIYNFLAGRKGEADPSNPLILKVKRRNERERERERALFCCLF